MVGIEYLTSHNESSDQCACPHCILNEVVADLFDDPHSYDIEVVDALTRALVGALSVSASEYRTYLVEQSIIDIRTMMGEHNHYTEGWGLLH
jgi:hypothetical protein|tara:strand:- start:9995 stop:10270 length:276 start_codon:yes stop_codon:yes gene_type:complete